MSKNIVICCDGTDSQFSGDHTNVIRAYKVAERSLQQTTFYDCGLGTMPEPWNTGHISQRWSMLKGLVMGSGFMQNIEDAYRFLMLNYEAGDKVYLFGFSRGAFTARALAAMLYSVGLLYPGTENLIRYAQKYWRKNHRDARSNTKSKGQYVCENFKLTLARSCPVHFIGVWDTVSSVGPYNQFPFTARNPEVTHVRHALSIDERRSFFRQNLMFKENSSQDVKNVWFAGVHADVGGGYPPNEAGLAKITFEWMMREAGACGLKINADALRREFDVSLDPCVNQHYSLKGGWLIAELIPMRRYSQAFDDTGQRDRGRYIWRIPFGRSRDIMGNAARKEVYLHQSVIERINGRISYRPKNIPHDTQELHSKFKIET